MFVKVENATASLIAKTLNPIVGPTADHNFVESMKFVERLNETTQTNGVGVQRMANRLNNLQDSVRQNFIKVAGLVYERNNATAAARTDSQQPPQRTGARPVQSSSSYIPTGSTSRTRLIPYSFSRGGIRRASYHQ